MTLIGRLQTYPTKTIANLPYEDGTRMSRMSALAIASAKPASLMCKSSSMSST